MATVALWANVSDEWPGNGQFPTAICTGAGDVLAASGNDVPGTTNAVNGVPWGPCGRP